MGRTLRQRRQRQNRLLSKADTADDTTKKSTISYIYQYLAHYKCINVNHLSVYDFRETGRGLRSKKTRIEKGMNLISMPLDSLITLATLESDQSFCSQFLSNSINEDDHSNPERPALTLHGLMAFYILYKWKLAITPCSQEVTEELSPLQLYLKCMPRYFTTVSFCNEEELKCLPSNIQQCILRQNEQIQDNYQHLETIINSSSNVQKVLSSQFREQYSLDEYRWSYFIINTRSVYISYDQIQRPKTTTSALAAFIKGSCDLALAPFLDLFNHSDRVETSSHLIRKEGDQQFNYAITLDNCPGHCIDKYQQIFINYGRLSNLELLLEYGFILRDNKYDYLIISLKDIEEFLHANLTLRRTYTLTLHRDKFKFIREHNLNDGMFLYRDESISHNFHLVLHLLFNEVGHSIKQLNRIAFGSFDQLANVDVVLKLFLKYKSKEYRWCIQRLQSLDDHRRTHSAEIVIDYLRECLKYFEKEND